MNWTGTFLFDFLLYTCYIWRYVTVCVIPVKDLSQQTICTSPWPSHADSQRLRVSAALNGAFNSQRTKEKGKKQVGKEGGQHDAISPLQTPRGQKQLLSLSVWPSCGRCRTTSLRFAYGYLDKEALIQVSRGASHFDWSICWVHRLFWVMLCWKVIL